MRVPAALGPQLGLMISLHSIHLTRINGGDSVAGSCIGWGDFLDSNLVATNIQPGLDREQCDFWRTWVVRIGAKAVSNERPIKAAPQAVVCEPRRVRQSTYKRLGADRLQEPAEVRPVVSSVGQLAEGCLKTTWRWV